MVCSFYLPFSFRHSCWVDSERSNSSGARGKKTVVKRDKVATELCGFKDDRSYCAPDGRQVCYGLDWVQRKKELWIRCRGRCEQMVEHQRKWMGPNGEIHESLWTPERCFAQATEPHHVIRRSKARDDRLQNLLGLCHFHHALQEKQGPNRNPRWSKHENRSQV